MSDDRAKILLQAAYPLLKKCNRDRYVLNALGTTLFYDGVDCDVYCLKEDIGFYLGIEQECCNDTN